MLSVVGRMCLEKVSREVIGLFGISRLNVLREDDE